ncbi:hypothetical protein [Citrobacter amalonaticus]|uniref:Lipoprotein n=2 Tax=Enterobacterales TaxID=91347 RepID=A0A6N2UFR8_CITAM|nr:hypothetical protein [Citrobacter amalonaticus]MDT7070848.1 hypothetical protein [Citrobacter amalonaticus]HEM8621104.1 hypothetical protein [Citrobacter amalonaticus]
MFKYLCVICLSLFITACKPSDEEMIKFGESLVKQSLKDPESAKFNSFYRQFGDGVGYVCGTVNAKNSYGGYVGNRNYYVHLTVKDGKVVDNSPVKIIDEKDDKGEANFNSICQ